MAFTDGLVIKLANILLFLFLLGSNVYTVAGPEDAYASTKETWVTPAYPTFYVWTLTHLLLAGTMIYQFTAEGKRRVVDTLQWRFALLVLLNAAYVWTWSRHHYIVAFFLSLFVAASVSQIYYIVRSTPLITLAEPNDDDEAGEGAAANPGTVGGREGLAEELFVQLPFSLYHGWTIVLVVLSAFAAFGASVHKHHGHPSLWSKIFVLLALIFLESTAAAYAFSSREGDPAGAAVIAFALFGIFIHQRPASGFVGWTAFAAFVLSLFAIAKSAWGTVRSRNGGAGIAAGDEERQSLLSAAS